MEVECVAIREGETINIQKIRESQKPNVKYNICIVWYKGYENWLHFWTEVLLRFLLNQNKRSLFSVNKFEKIKLKNEWTVILREWK